MANLGCARLERRGSVAILVVDNPPLNAISHGVREAIMQGLEAAARDEVIEALVIGCAGRSFFVGADIAEFNAGPRPPLLREVVAALDASAKPVVAALHGMALGGGLEVALGCHWRIAAAGSRLGLPEVKLGLIPGAGALRLLPRLVGVEQALAMACLGGQVSAGEALEAGLVDQVVEGEVIEAAVAFASSGPAARPTSQRAIAPVAEGVFEEFAGRHAKKLRQLEAPPAAIRVMRAAARGEDTEAARLEARLFASLRDGGQSKALRHLFAAEREAAKVPGLKEVAPARIERIGIVGAGTMGTGIAAVALSSGFEVTLSDRDDAALERAGAAIGKMMDRNLAAGRMDAAGGERAQAALSLTGAMDGLAEADLVIEAAFEKMEVKQAIFADLARVAGPDCILATNTSYLDIDAIARAGKRPERTIGLHFFSPAQVMKLLEIVPGEATSDGTLASALWLAKRLGKQPVVAGNAHGFIGNRMFAVRKRETDALLAEGASPAEIDGALEAIGFAMGPCRVSDLTGLDIGWTREESTGVSIRERLCEAGRFGQKAGRGFYDYDDGGRAVPSLEVEAIIADFARERGIGRRDHPAREMRGRLIWPMVNEGAVILEEGVAKREGDIDVAWVHGYGWPAWTGGPMFHARRHGLGLVVEELRGWGREPSEALVRMAD